MEKIKILLADDHNLVRDGIKGYLAEETDIEVVAEAVNGEQAIHLAREIKPDVVMLDISMPKINGMEAAASILTENPEIKVIILSMYKDEKYILKCMEEGVHGYIHKGADKFDLIYGLREVLNGEQYFSKEIREVMVKSYSSNLRKKKNALKEAEIILTKREKEILKMLTMGKTSSQIADELFISKRTVDTHRSNLMQKLSSNNVISLINKAKELGLLEDG